MAQINKPSDYFNTVLYTGNGSTQSITGVGFQPDWIWIKCRADARDHKLTDVVRGVTKSLRSNGTNAEATDSGGVTAFGSDGFSLGTTSGYNNNTETFVSWNWLADNTSGSSNTDGSITSTVSANTTAGFSILTRTGTGSNGTVGHGLGVAPKVIINKDINSGSSWWGVYHESLGNTNAIYLNTTNATDANVAYWNNTSPTSSVFSVGTNSISNASGGTYISYCFAEKKGFSKFGSYEGNGDSDGTFVYTGFKPAFVITKRADTGGDNWHILDNKRDVDNPAQEVISANANTAEGTTSTSKLDFLSNGFKCRGTGSSINTNGLTYIYIAFAEQPLVGTNNIPATAR